MVEDELIEILKNTELPWEKAEIIARLNNDERKLKLLEEFPDARKAIVIASLSSEEKKIQLLDELKYEGDKVLVIISLREETREKFLNILSDRAKSKVILSFKGDEKKIKLLKMLEIDSNKASVIMRLKNIRMDLIMELDDEAKLQMFLSLKSLQLRKKIVHTIYAENYRTEAILQMDDEDKINLLGNIKKDENRVKIISSLKKDKDKLELLNTVNDEWGKVRIISSLSNDDKKIRIMNKVNNNMARLQIIISIKNANRRMQFLSRPRERKYVKILKEMYKKNNQILNNIDVRLLQDKYIQTLGIDKINYISCYADIQDKILRLNNKQYEIFQRCLNSYLIINKTDDWTIVVNYILNNIEEYSVLINSINDFDDIDIEKLTKILQDKNFFQIQEPEDIKFYEKIKRDKCDQIVQNSTDIIEVKNAVCQKIFGHSLEFAKIIIEKYGEDIERIEECDEKYYVLNLKTIMQIKDIQVLQNIYEESNEIWLTDKSQIDRKLKSIYAKLLNSGLYRTKEEMRLDSNELEKLIQIEKSEMYEELRRLKIYKAGNEFNMIVTSVTPFANMQPSNFKENWNRASVASPHFCASYIRQDSIKTIKIPYACYGFTNMDDDALVLAGTQDIGTSGISSFVSDSFYAERYFSPDTLIEKTDLYNEVDFRREQKGIKVQPSYIVAFKRNGKIANLEMIIKAAKDWNNTVPIVLVDVDECEKLKENQVIPKRKERKVTIQDMEENDKNVTISERKEGMSIIRQLYLRLQQLTQFQEDEEVER